MLNETAARTTAYQVLDQVLANQAISAGARGTIFTAVDSLRASAAPTEQIRCAEDISVEMHRLEWALQTKDDPATSAAIQNLKALAARWLDTRISGRN